LIRLAPRLTDAEREAHRAFVATLGDKPIWNDFLPPAPAAEAAAS
jgi:DNA polymerase III subunit epsilon